MDSDAQPAASWFAGSRTHPRLLMSRLTLTLWILAAALSGAANAGVRIDASGDCGPLLLQAERAPLSVVLRLLAERRGFALAYEAATDPQIDTALELPEGELARRLTRAVNAAITTEPDPRCGGAPRVAKIWLMPQGGERPPQPVPAYVPTAQDQEAQRLYRRAHGLDDEGRPVPRNGR
jgi:hypothetical protein